MTSPSKTTLQWTSASLMLDIQRLVQAGFADLQGSFCGFGVATSNLQSPAVDWAGQDIFTQKEGINQDFGLFDTPDAFYRTRGVNLSGIKQWLYTRFIRHWVKRNVDAIRTGRIGPAKRHVQRLGQAGKHLGGNI